jgi:hypothetical protein
MADDGSLQPVAELTNLFPALNPIIPIWPTNGEQFTNIIIASWPGILETFTNFQILPIVPTTVEPYTNGFLPPTTNYNYGQTFQLTADQVQRLVEGKWYAEVDYGDDKYLGNLMPMSIAQPTATITVSPVTEFPSGINITPPWNPTLSDVVIAPANNKPATVMLNGSGSDPFGFPWEYRWLNRPNVLANTAATTNQWHTGTYQIQFEASDGVVAGTEDLTLEVISPEDAVNDLGSAVEQSYVNMRTVRDLTLMLSRAKNSFAFGDARSGETQLADFQRRVRIEMMPTDSTTANWLIEGSQEIIEAVEEPGR